MLKIILAALAVFILVWVLATGLRSGLDALGRLSQAAATSLHDRSRTR